MVLSSTRPCRRQRRHSKGHLRLWILRCRMRGQECCHRAMRRNLTWPFIWENPLLVHRGCVLPLATELAVLLKVAAASFVVWAVVCFLGALAKIPVGAEVFGKTRSQSALRPTRGLGRSPELRLGIIIVLLELLGRRSCGRDDLLRLHPSRAKAGTLQPIRSMRCAIQDFCLDSVLILCCVN